jgi:hypothetical protein
VLYCFFSPLFFVSSFSVRRKGDTAVDTIKAGEGLDSLGEKENAEKQLVLKGVKLLANEEFEKECGEYAADAQECTVSRKRKASEKLLSSKYVWHPICDLIVILLPVLWFKIIFFVSS